MNPLERLTKNFERFPGIGPRQARRFVQFLLVQQGAYRTALADDIKRLGANSFQCKKCFRWSVKNGSSHAVCTICRDAHRETGLLCVVEKDADLDNVERSGFKGLYFVLGGTIPLAAEEPEAHVRARECIMRIEEDGTKGVLKEVILGLSATTLGDHTRGFLQEKILPIAQALNFKITSLGRGLSTGSELEYADPDTIASALSSRY
ncbi:recombination protein RecR [Patescibacteria group bacterium]|nr:recombination protein RecR [Patescibacteria group bacterium]